MKGLLFTYGLTYGGAIVALFNPFVGLLIYVSFAILQPPSLWPWSVPPSNYSEVVAIALLIGWLARGLGSWRFGPAWPIVGCLLGFWAFSAFGALFVARNQEVGWAFTLALSKILLPFLVAVTTIDSIAKLRALVWVLATCQGYLAIEFNRYYFAGNNVVREQGFAGMDNNCVAIAMVGGCGLAFFLGMGASRWYAKLLALGLAAAMGHCVLLTFSRGGMLGLIATGAVGFFLLPKSPKHYLILGLAVMVGLRAAGPEVIARFDTTFAEGEERDYSAESRLDLWKACTQAMLDRPLTGLGPDQWPLHAHEYGFNTGKEAHSLWFQTLAELGLPGAAALGGFYVLAAGLCWRLSRRRADSLADPFLAEVGRMVTAALVGFCTSVSFVSLEGLELPYYIVALGVGALKLQGHLKDDAKSLSVSEWHMEDRDSTDDWAEEEFEIASGDIRA